MECSLCLLRGKMKQHVLANDDVCRTEFAQQIVGEQIALTERDLPTNFRAHDEAFAGPLEGCGNELLVDIATVKHFVGRVRSNHSLIHHLLMKI